MSATSSTSTNTARESKPGEAWSRDGVRHTAEQIGEELESAAGKAGRKVREVVDGASEEIDYASKKIGQSSEAVIAQIRSHPVQSSLMALAAGFVLGKLFRL